MLRKLLATGIVLLIGYSFGAIFGYRAAVVDYVENDADNIEDVADQIYPSTEEGGNGLPEAVRDAMEEKTEHKRVADSDDGSKGFQ